MIFLEAWRAELYHHGILGQKWGKRNGPPYPLDAGDHSARERKAGWRKSLNGGASEQTKKKIRNSVEAVKKVLPKRRMDDGKRRPESANNTNTVQKENSSGKAKKGLSPEAKKKMAIAATVAAVAVIGVVASRDPRVRQLASAGKKAVTDALSKNQSPEKAFERQALKEEKSFFKAQDKANKWTYSQINKESGGKYDSDFERELQKYLGAMDREQTQYKQAQEKNVRNQRKAQREVIRQMDKAVRDKQIEDAKKKVKKIIAQKRFDMELTRMLVTDDIKDLVDRLSDFKIAA